MHAVYHVEVFNESGEFLNHYNLCANELAMLFRHSCPDTMILAKDGDGNPVRLEGDNIVPVDAAPQLVTEAAYTSAYFSAVGKLSEIFSAIHDMPEPDNNTINWTNVGDLQEVASKLDEILTFMKG